MGSLGRLAPRRVAFVAALGAAFCVANVATAAEGAFTPCPAAADGECATLTVPLDRAGVQPGTVTLNLSRVRTSGAARGVIIPLAGGPGQAVSSVRKELGEAIRTAAAGRDIVFFDQRGTGKSGFLRCPVAARSNADADVSIRACADEIGAARSFYTSAESVLDIEAVRVLEGVDRITLYGVSYGTRVALEYARRFPQNVEALILDSVVPPDGSDPFNRSSFAAVKPALKAICARGACRGIATNPAADLTRLLARMGDRPLAGTFVDGRGRLRRTGVTQADLFGYLFAGDFNPALRAELPGALRSAAEGDPAALIRAIVGSRDADALDVEEGISSALFLTTTCEEEPVPWDRAALLPDRIAQVQSALALVPDAAFAPFSRSVAAEGPIVQICRNWPGPPVAPPAPVPPPPFPDVRVLAIAGKEDLRTPTTDAFAITALFPRAQYLEVPGVAHSVLASDASGCADRAIRQFLVGAPVSKCTATKRAVPPAPRAPKSLAAMKPSRGVPGRAGRTLRAVGLTLDDAVFSVQRAAAAAPSRARLLRAGGLRGGRLVATPNGLDLVGMAYVPGVVVTGRVREEETTLTISGPAAAAGSITIRDGRVTGVLGGVAIDRPVGRVRG